MSSVIGVEGPSSNVYTRSSTCSKSPKIDVQNASRSVCTRCSSTAICVRGSGKADRLDGFVLVEVLAQLHHRAHAARRLDVLARALQRLRRLQR